MRVKSAVNLLLPLVLAACAPSSVIEEPAAGPDLPLRSLAGAAHYRVVEDDTLVYARVFRGGSMAKLGHNHVVAFTGVRGDVYLGDGPAESLVDLLIPVAGVVVDPPALRHAQGRDFRTEISDDARSRTRDNMLGEKVLDAARHPYIVVSSSAMEGTLDEPVVTLDIVIREVTRQVTVPVSLSHDADGLAAAGRLDLRQSDFGMEPFQVLGGALRVQDRVELVFEIAARRVE